MRFLIASGELCSYTLVCSFTVAKFSLNLINCINIWSLASITYLPLLKCLIVKQTEIDHVEDTKKAHLCFRRTSSRTRTAASAWRRWWPLSRGLWLCPRSALAVPLRSNLWHSRGPRGPQRHLKTVAVMVLSGRRLHPGRALGRTAVASATAQIQLWYCVSVEPELRPTRMDTWAPCRTKSPQVLER